MLLHVLKLWIIYAGNFVVVVSYSCVAPTATFSYGRKYLYWASFANGSLRKGSNQSCMLGSLLTSLTAPTPSLCYVGHCDVGSLLVVSLSVLRSGKSKFQQGLDSTHDVLISAQNWYVTQVHQQRPESPTVTLTWHACKYKVHKFNPEVQPFYPARLDISSSCSNGREPSCRWDLGHSHLMPAWLRMTEPLT